MIKHRRASIGIGVKARFFGALLWLGVLMILAGCGLYPSVNNLSPKPMGLLEVSFSGIGSGEATASARWVSSLKQDATVYPVRGTAGLDDIEIAQKAIWFRDDPIQNQRYLMVRLALINRYDVSFKNLTFYAVNLIKIGRGGTALVMYDASGNQIMDESRYRSTRPAHAMTAAPNPLMVEPTSAGLQWLTPKEATSVQEQALAYGLIEKADTVLEYGFVASGPNGERHIGPRNTATNCTDSSCQGTITLAYGLPLQLPASSNPTKLKFYFVVGDETQAYTSQSLEEYGPNTVAGRTDSISFDQTRVLFGSNLTHPDNLSPLCQVKVAAPTTLNPIKQVLPDQTPSGGGSLDGCFGASGRRTLAMGNGVNFPHVYGAYGMAVQPDGRIVLATSVWMGQNHGYDFALARFNPDGSLDIGFGNGGRVITPVGLSDDMVQAMVLQPDGKLVLGGWTWNNEGTENFHNWDFALVRYNPSGTLDTGFGMGGVVRTHFDYSHNDLNTLVLQPDGKIVAGGSSVVFVPPNYLSLDFALVRYNQNGSLDTSFGTGGIVTTAFGNSTHNDGRALAIQPNGRLVMAGYTRNGNSLDIALARYNPNGSLDTTFDGDGRAVSGLSTRDERAMAIALQPDGKIVVAGDTDTDPSSNFNHDFTVARFHSSGLLDTSFGGGMVTTPFAATTTEQAYSVVIQSNGKIVLGGYSGPPSHDHTFALARYNPNGMLDLSFDGDGKVTTGLGGSSYARGSALAIQGDGRIVLGGTRMSSGPDFRFDLALARYNP